MRRGVLTFCVGCGKDGTFRFCSNACFLTYAKSRTDVECALCQYDPRTHRIGNPNTKRLCADCKKASENRGWNGGAKEETGAKEDVANWSAQPMSALSWQQLLDRRMRVTDLQTRILNRLREIRVVRYQRYDAYGRRNGWAEKQVGWTAREIAELEGCNERTVRDVKAMYDAVMNSILRGR